MDVAGTTGTARRVVGWKNSCFAERGLFNLTNAHRGTLWVGPVNPFRGKTTNRRAGCGKPARPVRREGSLNSIRLPYPYSGAAVTGPPPKDYDFKTRVIGGSACIILLCELLEVGQRRTWHRRQRTLVQAVICTSCSLQPVSRQHQVRRLPYSQLLSRQQ